MMKGGNVRDAERGVAAAASDASTLDGYTGHTRRLKYNFKIIALNPLKPELIPICYLLALLGAHHFLHVSRIRVKLLTLR